MKKLAFILALGLMSACSAAGTTTDTTNTAAQSNTTQSSQSTAQTSKPSSNKTQNSTSSKKDTTSSATESSDSNWQSSADWKNVSTSGFSDDVKKLQSGLKDAGYTIYDQDVESHEAEFKARGSVDTLEINVEQCTSAQWAQSEFLDEVSADYDESFTSGDAFVNDKGTLQVLYNDYNNLAEIAAWDSSTYAVYSIDDINENNLQTVLNVMQSLGFAIQ